jgi:hypothetical protein
VIVGAAAKRPSDFLESLQRLDLDKLEGAHLIAPKHIDHSLDILRHLCAHGADGPADRVEKMACNEIPNIGLDRAVAAAICKLSNLFNGVLKSWFLPASAANDGR